MTGIILIMIGLFLSTVDIFAIKICDYPVYEIVHKDDGMGNVIQEYVAKNMLGSELRLDVLSDMFGYVLIFVGITLLLKYNKKFFAAYIPLFATAGLMVYLKASPFLYTEKTLIVTALAVSFIQLMCEVFMERTVVYSVASATSDLPNERDTVLMKFGWVGSAICRVFIYFIVLVGLSHGIIIAYKIAQTAFMVFCLDRMFRCRHYLSAQ